MAIHFDLFRFSALRRRDDDLFSLPLPDRETFFLDLLGTPIQFTHWGHEFVFVPYRYDDTKPYIVGKVGRLVEVVEDTLTTGGFIAEAKDTWRAAYFVFDPRDLQDADGQRVAFERVEAIGLPQAVLKSFARHVSRKMETPYVLHVEPIFDAKSFWEFLREHPNDLTRLTLEFVAPNGFWNVDKSVRQLLSDEKKKHNADKIVQTLISEEGLRLKAEELEDEVGYIEAGSGKVVAKAKSGSSYNSSRRGASTSLGSVDRSDLNLSQLLAKFVGRVLGRE